MSAYLTSTQWPEMTWSFVINGCQKVVPEIRRTSSHPLLQVETAPNTVPMNRYLGKHGVQLGCWLHGNVLFVHVEHNQYRLWTQPKVKNPRYQCRQPSIEKVAV